MAFTPCSLVTLDCVPFIKAELTIRGRALYHHRYRSIIVVARLARQGHIDGKTEYLSNHKHEAQTKSTHQFQDIKPPYRSHIHLLILL